MEKSNDFEHEAVEKNKGLEIEIIDYKKNRDAILSKFEGSEIYRGAKYNFLNTLGKDYKSSLSEEEKEDMNRSIFQEIIHKITHMNWVEIDSDLEDVSELLPDNKLNKLEERTNLQSDIDHLLYRRSMEILDAIYQTDPVLVELLTDKSLASDAYGSMHDIEGNIHNINSRNIEGSKNMGKMISKKSEYLYE